jgi:hypothetical protein
MHFRKYKIWAKVSKLSLKRIGFIFLMILVSFGAFGQKQSKKVRQAQKKYEKSEEQKKIDYEKARKKSNQHKFKIQSKETQKRIKESKKEAKRNNNANKDNFINRIFKKNKAKKRK